MPWRSSGWNDHRNVQRLLALMVERGEVVTVGRAGREPLWDLAERVYPDDPVPDVEEARQVRAERELAALGIVRRSSAGEPARIEGVRGTWRVDPALLEDRLVGKLDATADRAEGALRVDAVHEDEPFDDETHDAVRAEILDLARWLDLDPVLPSPWD